MKYITREEDLPKCSHPSVNKIHEWGGGAVGGKQVEYLVLTMSDGERKTFEDFGNGEAVNAAEEFLNSLSPTMDKVKVLEEIMAKFGEARTLLAKTKLQPRGYNPISHLLADGKILLFKLYKELRQSSNQKQGDGNT